MGLILPQEVEVVWIGKLRLHLLSKGYPDMLYRSRTKVNVQDLPISSSTQVRVRCDFCGQEYATAFCNTVGGDGRVGCKACHGRHMSEIKMAAVTDRPLFHDAEWLRQEYITNKRSIADIAEQFCVSHQTVEKYLKRYNIRKRPAEIVYPSKEELQRLYADEKHGANYVASLYPGVGINTIWRLLDEYGIERQSVGEAMRAWWADGNNVATMGATRAAFWNDSAYREKHYAYLRDRESIAERAKKSSARYQGVAIDEWSGFLTPQNVRERGSVKYAEWRNAVFSRDDYRCQCCGRRSSSGNPVILNAHHIENFAKNKDLRYEVNNGITLCDLCHDSRKEGSFHSLYGTLNNNSEQLAEYMQMRGVTWTPKKEAIV